MISARRAAAYGLVSALAGMSTGHLVAALLAPESSPVLAVGAAVIDATPRAVKEWAVSTLGTADKPVLLASVSLGTAALAAVAGLLARRRVALGGALVALLGALALAAAITRPASTPLFAIPSLLAAGFGLATLRHLFRREAGTATLESPLDHTAYAPGAPATPRRRSILTGATGIGVGSALVGALGQSIIRSDPATNVTLPAPATPASALPTGLEATVPGVSSLQTPVSEFYRIDTALTIPRVDPQTWALTIDGMVDREVRLTFADILAMDLREIDVTINCVSNEVGGSYIGAARWTGVLVKDLLARAGSPSRGGAGVHGVRGWHDDLGSARSPDGRSRCAIGDRDEWRGFASPARVPRAAHHSGYVRICRRHQVGGAAASDDLCQGHRLLVRTRLVRACRGQDPDPDRHSTVRGSDRCRGRRHCWGGLVASPWRDHPGRGVDRWW